MKPDRDTLDEYFEYEAEEFLVNLALLITEGRTPEYSVKGRTEGFHCPPAQSGQPLTTKHECSDKLAQCRQARRTRSEVTSLWKNNIPIMVEVMLLPDCCYSDEGPATEGNDLNDPAVKQDALLLERWILEPVPRQSGDRFIEEKTLLLAVRSFVFFSQLSAWLSVSHGAVPRNILYRVSAAHVDLQWTFSQTPTEHFFPVPNVSHNVALKVSVQSLPRQSNYPVLTCSIHTSLGFYEKRIEERNGHQHCDSIKAEQHSAPTSQCLCGKPMWPEGILGARKGPELGSAVRTLKLYPSAGLGTDFRASESKLQCCTASVESKKLSPKTSERTLKPSTDSHNGYSSRHSLGDSIPLIGSLLQERHEVIARIAQHLIHCDPATSPIMGRPFSANETTLVNLKAARSTHEDESLLKKRKELSSSSAANLEPTSPANSNVEKARVIPEVPSSNSPSPVTQRFCQTIEEANPLISSLLQERQEVIARIAQHLIHCDPPTSHVPHPVFNVHETSSINPKGILSSYEDDILLKKGRETSSDSTSRLSSLERSLKAKGKTPATPLSSVRYDPESKVSPKPQVRRKLLLAESNEVVQNTFQQPPSIKNMSPLTFMIQSCKKEDNKSDLADKLEAVLSGSPRKPRAVCKGIAKQCSPFNCSDELICTEKLKDRTIPSENSNTDCLNNPLLDQSRILENVKVTVTQAPDSLHKDENKCSNQDSKQPNICEPNSQLTSIENYPHKDHESFKCKSKQDKVKNTHDENEDPTNYEVQKRSQKKPVDDGLAPCEQKRNVDVLQRTPPLKHVWRRNNFHHLDGTSTKAFHPRTGLPLLSSPVPERKTCSGYFDFDASLLQLKCLSSKSPQHSISKENDPDVHEKPFLSSSAPPVTSLSLLGNFEESVLNYRLDPLGVVDGFTAEVGASGIFCPTHMTLPVEVSFYSVSDDNAPSPYMGVITLESLGKRGYRVPPSGTIQVTLFNPNKTVVKMFVVIYDLREMPANHQTFLRQRTFSVPVRREMKRNINKENTRRSEERLLRYLIHLRFQSSKSGKIYLYRDVRLLFSRKSMEVDSGPAYELKSYTESPMNPQFSPKC